MCGIVGLLLKDRKLRPNLGELMVPMLVGMTERGPDSSGLAVFGESSNARARKLSLYCVEDGFSWESLERALLDQLGVAGCTVRANHCVLTTEVDPNRVREWLKREYPAVHVLSVGKCIDLYKDVGLPAEVAQRYAFAGLTGTHLVGHTRMATESAVTPENAHPYTAGEDWCLVHNGSLAV
jgi:glutamate synthase domain-containing protein 1